MSSPKRKKIQSGSAQVGDRKFTYEDRIRSFSAEALIGDAVAQVVALAREAGKPLVIENLDFSKKKDQLEGEYPGRSRMLSSFA